MTERLVVVGGDAAGMSAASQARRLRSAAELEIVVFERGSTTSYAACGIPYWVAGVVEEREDLIARSPEAFRRKQDIDVRIGHEVVAIDTGARRVTARAHDAEVTIDYDELLIATGASPVRPPLEGIRAPGVFGIQSLDDGQAVIDAMQGREARVAAVVGAGYIGLEMAEALLIRGLEVHVLDRAPRPMLSMDDDLGQAIADAMRGLGIHLHLEADITELRVGDDGWVDAVVTTDEVVACDLVVLGTGTRPNSDLAADAGIPVGPSGGIVTDRRQHTPVDHVWAAGDCAETFHRVTRAPVSIALGTIANKQGRIAGLNLGGDYGAFPGVLGTAVTKLCGLEIARTGLGEDEAEAAGFRTVVSSIDSRTRAHYYPGARPLTIKLVAERRSGRLLGAQILGEEGAAKRIDVFATALWNEMSVEDLLQIDLSYAPPFSPVWDPVLIAARVAAGEVADAG